MIESDQPQKLSRIRFYIRLIDTLKLGAEDYLTQQDLMPRYLDNADLGSAWPVYLIQRRERLRLIGKLSINLEKLYFSKEDPLDNQQHRQLLNSLLPDIDTVKGELITSETTLSFQQKKDVIFKAASLVTTLPGEQRMRLLAMMGYNPDEIAGVLFRLGIAGSISAALAWTSDGIAVAIGVVTTITKPYNSDISEPATFLPIIASEALWIGSVLLNGKINADMMREKIRFCPSILGYAAGMLSQNLTSDRKLQNRAVLGASITLDTIKELAVFFGPLAIGPNTLIGANLGGSLVGYLQALVSAGVVFGSRFKKRLVNLQSDN